MSFDQIQELVGKIAEKSNFAMKIFFLYLSIIGLFGFSIFILEESAQTVTFSNFVNKDTGRYDLIKKNNDKINKIIDHMVLINTYFMWMQPFQCISYADYIIATRAYVEAQEALVLAHDPGLYEGESVSLDFYYKTATQDRSRPNIWSLQSGKLVVFVDTLPSKKTIQISGIVTRLSINPELWGVK